jgi:hypothetical protein
MLVFALTPWTSADAPEVIAAGKSAMGGACVASVMLVEIMPNATNRRWIATRWPDFSHPVRCILAPGPDTIVVHNMRNVAPKLGGIGIAQAKDASKALEHD